MSSNKLLIPVFIPKHNLKVEPIDYFTTILYWDTIMLSYVYIVTCLSAPMHMYTHFMTLQKKKKKEKTTVILTFTAETLKREMLSHTEITQPSHELKRLSSLSTALTLHLMLPLCS